MHNNYRLILVEDDTSLGYLLTEYLRMKNFNVDWEKNGVSALKKMEESNYDLAILDVMMPEMDGFTLAQHMADKFPEIPFLFLTAKSLKVDVLKGFYIGAIDYLKKPIDEEELVIRIETLLNRLDKKTVQKTAQTDFNIGGYTFNALNQELCYGNEVIKLTAKESDLLKYLVQRKDTLCTHKDVLIALWGKNDYFNRKSLNVFITHLRKYLEKDAQIKIENVHSKGYIFRYGK